MTTRVIEIREVLKSTAQEYAQRMQMNHSDDGEKLTFDEWLQVMPIEEEKEDLRQDIYKVLRFHCGYDSQAYNITDEILKLINK